MSFDDIDANDVVAISSSYNGDLAYSGAGSLPVGLAAALTVGTFVASAAASAAPGSTSWTDTANDLNLDFLSEGETISLQLHGDGDGQPERDGDGHGDDHDHRDERRSDG